MSTPPDPDRRADPASAFSEAMRARPPSARERDLRRYGPPKRSTQWIWIAIAVIGLAVFVALMRGVMDKTRWTAGPSPDEAVQPPRVAVDDADAIARPAPTPPDCTRTVRRVAGAWTDACGSDVPTTRAERERAARRADAAADLAMPAASSH